MKLIRDDVNKIIAPFKKRKGFLYGRLLLEWEEIVGTDIASICAPYKMTFYKSKPGALVLQTKSSSALYLSSLEEDIIQMIHQYFEQSFVEKIQYKHVLKIEKPEVKKAKVIPFEKVQEIQSIVDEVEDSSIRNVLKKLGLSILNSEL